MKKQEFDERVKDAQGIVKQDGKVAMAKSNGVFSRLFEGLGKKILPVGIALTMLFSSLALSGCNDKKPPEQENPPIVDPTDPDKPDPDKPDPDKPDPDKPDPEKPDPDKPNPDDPIKTPEELQKEKEEKIAQNIYAAVEGKLEKRRHFVDKVMAIDYGKGENGSNYTYILAETTSTTRHLIELYRFPMETEMTEENILSGNVKPNKYDPTTMFSVTTDSLQNINTDTSKAIYEKVKSEELLESKNEPLVISHITAGGATDPDIGGYSYVHLYTLNNSEIEKNQFAVKDDQYETNAITDNLINGTLNKTFKKSLSNNFYHKFSEHALVNYKGLEVKKQEQVGALNGRKIGTYNNGRVYIN